MWNCSFFSIFRIFVLITEAVSRVVFQCRSLLSLNFVRFSLCHMVHVRLRNRFSAIQWAMHNCHSKRVHVEFPLRMNEQTIPDAFPCVATFFDTLELTISMLCEKWKMRSIKWWMQNSKLLNSTYFEKINGWTASNCAISYRILCN